jgi:hypothetical protein
MFVCKWDSSSLGFDFLSVRSQEEQQKLRMVKKPSPFRDQSVEENMRLFNEMVVSCVVGAKRRGEAMGRCFWRFLAVC